MFLSELLENIVEIPSSHDRSINGLSSDSRHINPGDLFIAYLGKPQEIAQYIEQAISQGAVAVLYPADAPNTQLLSKFNTTRPIIPIQQLDNLAGEIAARFYHHPSKNMQIIGITGTNGKTSCSQFAARAIQLSGQACGVIGTLGNGFPDQLTPGIFTTPDALGLQKLLANLKQQGAQAVSMEVSSHGLAQNRIAGVNFDIAVFTNLTRDHLDYHGSMENYAAAKHRLFTLPGLKSAVINADDNYGRQWIKEFSDELPVYAYSTQAPITEVPTIYATKVQCYDQGFKAMLHTPWGEGELQSGLLGRFNLSNLLAVLTVLGLMNIPLQKALDYLAQMPTVPGRMQRFGGKDKPLVVVDYSHTPDALEKALLALREHCQGQLWCVFGCGGDRDRGKRPLMGRIAQQYSDHFIITDDNPRHEDPEFIAQEINKGISNPKASKIIHDRSEAIAHAITCAKPGDVVLIAGKGHETYQQVGDEKLAFSDAEQVEYFLK
jgi:UDP-N-acetylmuramoyl-L-alanyl-D-glutamate--2,6-diaminopimelate ligase